MRVALVHKQLELKGGTERVLLRTAEGLRDRGHEVHLFCGKFEVPPPGGVMAHRVPCVLWPRTARAVSFAYLAPRIVARHSCDVVMSFDRIIKQDMFRSGGGPHRVFLEKMSLSDNRWRTLWYRLSPYHRSVLRIEQRQMSSEGSRIIIAVCNRIKQEIIEAYKIPEEKVMVVHNGVDHQRFHPRRRLEEGKQIRAGLGIPSDRRVVLFVGRGFRRKGLDRLLQIWDSAELRGICLLVVGDDAQLSLYRKRWNRKDILFVGAQSSVESYYAAADLFVLPSIQEAFGNAVLEALASGLPVITVAGVGPTDKMEGDLKEGILINAGDPEELKSKILRLLEPARWPSLSRAARVVSEQFSWQRYLDDVERSLSEMAQKPCAPSESKLWKS